VAALTFAAIASASTFASAQTVSAGSEDLILGFEVTDGAGQGATTDLEIDLGSASLFTASYSQTFSQVLAADLTATYGSNWATRGDISWGVAGVLSDGSTSNAFDLTSQTVPKTSNNNGLASGFSAISALAGGLNNQTALTSSSAADVSTTQASSWKGERTVSASSDFNALSGAGVSETTSTTGSIDLYQFEPSTARPAPNATDLGTFSLTSGGVFTFTGEAAAVPEPSAYALGICALVLFVVLRRRSTIA